MNRSRLKTNGFVNFQPLILPSCRIWYNIHFLKARINGRSKYNPKTDNLYFDIQADFGITKHMGGQRATHHLAELCHVEKGTSLLVVGCGIGSSLVYLANQFGCQITAIDLSAGMIARATERVQRHGLEKQITLKVGDAQKLEFEKNRFDAVMAESVNAFLPDQPKE